MEGNGGRECDDMKRRTAFRRRIPAKRVVGGGMAEEEP